jgi:hypothetical protein
LLLPAGWKSGTATDLKNALLVAMVVVILASPATRGAEIQPGSSRKETVEFPVDRKHDIFAILRVTIAARRKES